MNKMRIWLVMLTGLVLLLAGCGRAAQPEPTATSLAPAQTELPTPTVTAQPQVNYCVECHTDKDSLIRTAKPEEEVVEESEGAG
jgi:hypothetical protein